MSLTLPIDELGRFQVCIRIAPTDGRLSLNLKPANMELQSLLPTSIAHGLSINFETTDYGLCVFASFDPAAAHSATHGGEDNSRNDEAHVAGESSLKKQTNSRPPTDVAMGDAFHVPDVVGDGMSGYSLVPWLTEWPGHYGSNAMMYKDSLGGSEAGDLLPPLFSSDSLEPSGRSANDLSDRSALYNPASLGDMDFRQSQFDLEWSSIPNQHSHSTPSPSMGLPSPPCTNTPTVGSEEILPSPKSDMSEVPSEESPTPAPTASSSGTGTGTGKQRRRRFSCIHPQCDRQFTSEYTRKVHMTTHEVKIKKSLPCTMGCMEVFSRQHDRLRHEVAQHGKPCEWSCTTCRRFFSSQRMLQNHKCHGMVSNSRWTVPEAAVPKT